MKYYQLTKDGSYVCDGKTLPPQDLTPIIITETDEDGNETEVELPAPVHYLYANMMVEVEAGEAEILPYVEPEKTQEQINAEHRAYLDSTDWYAVRKSETGEKIPNQILKARQDARDGIIE